jgi:hypothetical protein
MRQWVREKSTIIDKEHGYKRLAMGGALLRWTMPDGRRNILVTFRMLGSRFNGVWRWVVVWSWTMEAVRVERREGGDTQGQNV